MVFHLVKRILTGTALICNKTISWSNFCTKNSSQTHHSKNFKVYIYFFLKSLWIKPVIPVYKSWGLWDAPLAQWPWQTVHWWWWSVRSRCWPPGSLGRWSPPYSEPRVQAGSLWTTACPGSPETSRDWSTVQEPANKIKSYSFSL